MNDIKEENSEFTESNKNQTINEGEMLNIMITKLEEKLKNTEQLFLEFIEETLKLN